MKANLNKDTCSATKARKILTLDNKNFLNSMISYIEVTKPPSTALLAFTAWATMVVASRSLYSGTLTTLALLAIILGCGGANAVSCYIDLDLDTVMERTQKRPLPSGRISPPSRALMWGIAQIAAATLIAGWFINLLSAACILAGAFGYLYIYSIWLKRKSSWNIILGGFSGGMPVLFGWSAATGSIDFLPFFIAAVVVLWIPNHIWSLAIYYSDDYKKVKVPMFSAIVDIKKALHCILATVVLMYAFSIFIYWCGDFGPVYLLTAVACGAAVTALNIFVCLRPSKKLSWTIFKISSPYLFILFLGMMIDVLIRF